ncbi:MAG: ribose 1,5-bisphosphate isomerase [Candidatus Hadarchaeum sp.]|uniref:ribose 1,5-bisphosphate isomerase n=1 Tax=Candidatus Hadarchaeum sp. TaxID=2883567 RepID=UPI00317966BB
MVNEKIKKIAQDIKTMRIRGAGRIARAAARALKIAAIESQVKTPAEFSHEMETVSKILLETRPTAVSLPNAIRYVLLGLKQAHGADLWTMKKTICSRADDFIKNSLEAVKKIGEIGANRISSGDVLLTHCNSECALSIIKTAFKQGKNIEVITTESRPVWQGRLSAKELLKEGIPTTMIIDSAVRHFIRDVDKVIVGADSIAANGAVVNKIGTSSIALAAHEARVLFFVAAETYKFHPETLVGRLVEIEERDPNEIINLKRYPGLKVRNPAFDITPPEYVDLIVTERGIIPPYAAYAIIQEIFEWKPGNGPRHTADKLKPSI